MRIIARFAMLLSHPKLESFMFLCMFEYSAAKLVVVSNRLLTGMEPLVSHTKIKINAIKRRRNYEILRKHQLKNEVRRILVTGQKLVSPPEDSNREHETAALDAFENDLEKLRVEMSKSQTKAVYDQNEGAVFLLNETPFVLTRFGYRKNNKHYFHYFEALALLEMKRIQIDYGGLPMSIEQAFVLLLGESCDMKFDLYFVYSHLTRLGFHLFLYENVNYDVRKESIVPSFLRCSWEIAMNNFQTPQMSSDVRNSPNFDKAMQNLLEHRRKIIGVLEPVNKKSIKFCSPNQTNSAQNTVASSMLLTQYDYLGFEKAFEEFQYIALPRHGFVDKDAVKLKISFDLYLPHQKPNKQCSTPPSMRLVVLSSTQLFPTQTEIRSCFTQQVFKIPLALIHFDDFNSCSFVVDSLCDIKDAASLASHQNCLHAAQEKKRE